MNKLTAIQAKSILKKTGVNLICRSLKESSTKNPSKQLFYEPWCGVALAFYVFNHEDKTVREGNYFDVDGKMKFLYYKKPAINISEYLK
jgi:uncharacterized radical SAM superfamily Fe-S cluster-containing enzyme